MRTFKNILSNLLAAVVAVIFIFYFYGIVGLIKSFKSKNDKDCNYYTVITIFNILIWCGSFYLYLKLSK